MAKRPKETPEPEKPTTLPPEEPVEPARPIQDPEIKPPAEPTPPVVPPEFQPHPEMKAL